MFISIAKGKHGKTLVKYDFISINSIEPAIAAMHGPTALSDSVIRSETSLITRSDSVIKLVLVLFGKCTTLVITKC